MFRRDKIERIPRIGIFAGTFNPVHAGHLAFALQAVKKGNLDKVYFLPERRPRGKHGVEHYGHRVAMLRRATKPYRQFGVLDFDDVSFTVKRTLPKLSAMFPGARLVLLAGSDVTVHMPDWPQAEQLFATCELIVGTRSQDARHAVLDQTHDWRVQPLQMLVVESHAADISSSQVREALRQRQHAKGLLSSVAHYSNRNWLYISLV